VTGALGFWFSEVLENNSSRLTEGGFSFDDRDA
jgi:hypothetical protein